jgi:hypothetical protein
MGERPQYIEVSRAIVRRHFDCNPFVLTNHYVAPELGQQLAADGVPAVGEGTVIGAAEKFLQRPVYLGSESSVYDCSRLAVASTAWP